MIYLRDRASGLRGNMPFFYSHSVDSSLSVPYLGDIKVEGTIRVFERHQNLTFVDLN